MSLNDLIVSLLAETIGNQLTNLARPPAGCKNETIDINTATTQRQRNGDVTLTQRQRNRTLATSQDPETAKLPRKSETSDVEMKPMENLMRQTI